MSSPPKWESLRSPTMPDPTEFDPSSPPPPGAGIRVYLDWLERWADHCGLNWLGQDVDIQARPRRLRCAECGRDDDGRRGWRMQLDMDDELVTFCADCDEQGYAAG